MRNAAMHVSTASASATFTADQIVVGTALNGLQYVLYSFNKTINLATTGAGGMDTGSAPTSGYVALYAIYNPSTSTASILATNATSAVAPTIYGGSNMPSGYTASALISVWPTNGSGQFIVGNQFDRSFKRISIAAFNTTTQEASPTSVSISSVVPPNAKSCNGVISVTNTNSSTGNTASIYGDVNGISAQVFQAYISTTGGASQVPFSDVALATPQTIFYAMNTNAGTITLTLTVNGYTI